MQEIRNALKQTTSHALPRTLSQRPLIVRIVWLLLFLAFLGLFLKGLADFIVKLMSRQVTTTQEINAVTFTYPDVYACFENAISTSYAAEISDQTVEEINRQLGDTSEAFDKFYGSRRVLARSGPAAAANEQEQSFAYVQSLQYSLLVDNLAHRLEQSVVTSDVTYVSDYGLPSYDPIQATSFYHPVYLHCMRWVLNATVAATLAKSGTSSGLVATLLIDANHSEASPRSPPIASKVFVDGAAIPVSDWSLSRLDYDDPDRRAGVRIFLCPPGEYPTEFVTSFSLAPGLHHTVEIDMNELKFSSGSYECIGQPPPVQFVNPYTQQPYNHAYSYSYCYYYEYHRQYQAAMNLSGDASPLPWPLRGRRFLFNLTGEGANFLSLTLNTSSGLVPDNQLLSRVNDIARNQCLRLDKSPCTTLNYDVTISSSDWPTYSSVAPFVAGTVVGTLASLKSRNLTAPALEHLASVNLSAAAAYMKANLLKVSFKPRRMNCNRVTLSIDYGFGNFVSDVGGIMGLYLGMSLLTLCEILELSYDLMMACIKRRRRGEQSDSAADSRGEDAEKDSKFTHL